MNKNTFLFDMDGTLLSMDTDEFVHSYFKALCVYFKDEFAPEEIIKAVKLGTGAMLAENKPVTNINTFFEVFNKTVGCTDNRYFDVFNNFYETLFDKLDTGLNRDENMIEAVKILKEKGYTVAVASNPLFPKIAQVKRLAWGGYNPDDFVYVSCGEDSKSAKPSKYFYKEVLDIIGKNADECYMVGNDVTDDMIEPQNLGMETYLITNQLINKQNIEYSGHKGDSKEFLEFVKNL